MKKTFTAKLQLGPTGAISLIEIPFDVREVFGRARAPVRGSPTRRSTPEATR